ncbi:hypothetical protein N8222_06225 [Oceanospirillaceae bacterium]|nr:hypothetical protein [Oceanospirillaceae bacterium]
MFEYLDPYVSTWLPIVLGKFTHLSFGFTIFSLLIFIALVSSFKYFLAVRKVTRVLNRALKCLEDCANEQEFTEQFTIIDQSLSDIPEIKQVWQEYVETLIPPLDKIDDPAYQIYRNTLRPQSYFTEKYVFRHVTPLIKSETLIGIGLLFTFIGLVAALTESGNAFAGNSDEIKDALTKLLAVAGAKFLASVGGLGGSIIQGGFISVFHKRAARTLQELNHKIESCLQYASVERIAADQYGYAQRQTERLEQLSNEITMSLGQRIDSAISSLPEQIGSQMERVMKPMSDQLINMTDGIADTNTEALETMASNFVDSLKGAGQQSMDQVVDQLASLSEAMTGTIASLNTGSESMQSGLEQAVMSLEKAAQELQNSLSGGASKAAESMESSGSAMAETLTSVLNDIKKQQSVTADALTQVVEKLNEASDTAGSRMGDAVHQAAISTAAAVKDSTEGLTQMVTTEMSSSISQMNDMLESAASKVSGGLTQWANSTDQVSSSLVSINNQLNVNKQGLQESAHLVSQSSTAMRDATTSAKSSIDTLSRIANTIEEASKAIQETSKENSEAVSELAELVSTTVEEGNNMLASLKNTWETQEKVLSGADDALASSFKQITENLESSLGRLSEFSQSSSDQFSEIVNGLMGMVDALQETVEDLQSPSGR